MGFPFLFAICAGAMIAIGFVDIEKGREDARRFSERTKVNRVVAETGLSADAIVKGKIPAENEGTSAEIAESSEQTTGVHDTVRDS